MIKFRHCLDPEGFYQTLTRKQAADLLARFRREKSVQRQGLHHYRLLVFPFAWGYIWRESAELRKESA